jgi:large subunit ribosomal protein L17
LHFVRHRIYGKHLGRNKNERQRLFTSLVRSLLLHGTIQTSLAKAKAISPLVDKIINSTKKNPNAYGGRTSGYTSIVKLGRRLGDQTMMVRMSLIGAEELKPIEKKVEKKQVAKEKAVKTK